MNSIVRIGTRESALAVWQATQVKNWLAHFGYPASLVYIKSEGDIDLKTPLYEMGVQGIFTRSLDIALLTKKIDLAVHSLKDVPTQLPAGIMQAAVLKRGSWKDLLVYQDAAIPERLQQAVETPEQFLPFRIATSSIRRKAQWLHRFPGHTIDNLRGNVNSRMQKLGASNWDGAIFAAAGLERIGLRPEASLELDWMLPAPAQGAVAVVCREDDSDLAEACAGFNDAATAVCTRVEREFLRTLLGGCSTPISALAEIKNETIRFRGNIFSIDGKEKLEIEKSTGLDSAAGFGSEVAEELLLNGGKKIADGIRHAAK